MILLKSLLAGIAAVVLAAIALLFAVVIYLWIQHPPNTGTDLAQVGWDPIALAKPATWGFVVIGIFAVGFLWEFFRATRK